MTMLIIFSYLLELAAFGIIGGTADILDPATKMAEMLSGLAKCTPNDVV